METQEGSTTPRRRRRRGTRTLTAAGIGLAAIAGAACEYDPTTLTTLSAWSTCAGKQATIGIGWSQDDGLTQPSYTGTEGDDVVVIVNGPVSFQGLGGDDTICIADTGLDWWYGKVVIDAGPGNDVVLSGPDPTRIHQERPELMDADVHVSLGEGNDWFVGGAETDFVTGGRGDDLIATGGGNDTVFDWGAGDYLDCGAGEDWYLPTTDTSRINCEIPIAFGGGRRTDVPIGTFGPVSR